MAKVVIPNEENKKRGVTHNRLDQATVINRFESVHGKRYDYSRVVYENIMGKVEIGCKIHGFFWQSANDHAVGKGCSKCGRLIMNESKKLDQGIVIDNFQKVHGFRYNYLEVVYVGNKSKVKIGCDKHGYFWQSPNSHLKNQGCPKCGKLTKAKNNTLDQAAVIKSFVSIHGDRYDYSRVVYIKNSKKVEIGCISHGFFWQTSSHHTMGFGCPECGKINRAESNTLDHADVINNFRYIHADRYDYSRIVYKGNKVKVEIGCKIHGFFWQSPKNHLKNQGCSECGKLAKAKSNTLNRSTVINNFVAIHGDIYDYSRIVYDGGANNTKVEIGCKKHGFFWQTPSNHSRGHGCPVCNESKGERAIRDYLTGKVGFETQKRFKEHKEVSTLKFDYYIPKFVACIEFNGRQHYESVKIFGGEKALLENKERDKRKVLFCIKNHIKLIIIPYWDFDNIESILKRELKNTKKPTAQLQIF